MFQLFLYNYIGQRSLGTTIGKVYSVIYFGPRKVDLLLDELHEGLFQSPCVPTCRYAAVVWSSCKRPVCPHHHCCISWPGKNPTSWEPGGGKLKINNLTTFMILYQQGTHESLRGNSRALSTVTAIIDGTGSIGVYAVSEIDLFFKLQPFVQLKKPHWHAKWRFVVVHIFTSRGRYRLQTARIKISPFNLFFLWRFDVLIQMQLKLWPYRFKA